MTRIRTSCAAGLPLAVLLVLLLPAAGRGQTSAGKIIGVVQDSSGGVLPGVSIVIRNLGTGNSRETLTDDRGQFDVAGLAPGRYQVDAELQGFRKFSQGPVTVQVNQETRINATLSVGNVQETLTVTAEGVLVQTSTSVVGKVVDEKQILQLPLSGRNFADLGLLTPGVTTRGQGTSAGTSTSSFYVHGQRNDANNFLLDGVSDNSLEGNVLQARPNVDAVQEFKIQTSNFSAEFGRNTGSVVNVVTKSGTNAFTGSGWEFVRSDKFQAKNFFATTEPPPLTFNQYGGTMGGPVIRNKTFFFGSFEGYREARGLTRQTIVATAQERAGNFSFLSKALIDPSTGLPFPGNVIPLNRIDPAALRLLTLMPLPNIPGVAPRQNNYVSSPESAAWRARNSSRTTASMWTRSRSSVRSWAAASWAAPVRRLASLGSLRPRLAASTSSTALSSLGNFTGCSRFGSTRASRCATTSGRPSTRSHVMISVSSIPCESSRSSSGDSSSCSASWRKYAAR